MVTLQTISSSFNSFFKVLFIFRSRYLFAIGLSFIFSFRWNLPPTLTCNPKQADSQMHLVYNKSVRKLRGYHSPWRCLSTTLVFPDNLFTRSFKDYNSMVQA